MYNKGKGNALPACERRRASDFAQSTNSLVRPSTNGSRRFFRIVISFPSLSFCIACTLKANKDFVRKQFISKTLIEKLYLHLVLNFLLPDFRRNLWVFINLNSSFLFFWGREGSGEFVWAKEKKHTRPQSSWLIYLSSIDCLALSLSLPWLNYVQNYRTLRFPISNL